MKVLQAVRGMNDYFTEELAVWRSVERTLRELVEHYGYGEVLTPVVESAELFIHSVGEESDIVAKEMYMFEDRNGDRLVLRPEGTASCIRAGLEHGKFYNQRQKWYYLEPMFRHERPQRGRYRQFYQFGVEAYGWHGIAIDAEMLQMIKHIWLSLKLEQLPVLYINSLGDLASRMRYRQALVEYFNRYQNCLDEDGCRCLARNPLRILDSKNPVLQNLIREAPSILDHLGRDSRMRWDSLQALLNDLGIAYRIEPRLVRGLDYYNDTVFEWVVTNSDGSNITACGGGRYDQLIGSMGGQDTPAIGFAFGFERLLALLDKEAVLPVGGAHGCYLIALQNEAVAIIMRLADQLRQRTGMRIEVDYIVDGNLKNQLKRADRRGVQWVIVVGEEELKNGQFLLKKMTDGTQQLVSEFELFELITG